MAITLFLMALFMGPEEPPDVLLSPDQAIVIQLPRTYLKIPKVARMLRSGLTTSFLFTVKGRAPATRTVVNEAAARIDVRYEPWDEIYLISMIHYDGRNERLTAKDLEALMAFFEQGSLRVGRGPTGSAGDWIFQVTLKVLPYSESEMAQTQSWFSEKLGEHTEEQDPNKVLDLLLATSIKRRSVISDFWRVEVSW